MTSRVSDNCAPVHSLRLELTTVLAKRIVDDLTVETKAIACKMDCQLVSDALEELQVYLDFLPLVEFVEIEDDSRIIQKQGTKVQRLCEDLAEAKKEGPIASILRNMTRVTTLIEDDILCHIENHGDFQSSTFRDLQSLAETLAMKVTKLRVDLVFHKTDLELPA